MFSFHYMLTGGNEVWVVKNLNYVSRVSCYLSDHNQLILHLHCLPSLHLEHESISSTAWAAHGIWRRSIGVKRPPSFHNKNENEGNWPFFSSVVFIKSLPSYFSFSFIFLHLSFSIPNGKWNSTGSVKRVVEVEEVRITCTRWHQRCSIFKVSK